MSARDAGGPDGFDRWLADGLAPDDHDRAAGHQLAASWRARRRALEAAAARRPVASERWRLVRWWAPVAVVAIAAVAAVAWPTPIVVDERALAGAYLDAMGTLPVGGAVTWLRTAAVLVAWLALALGVAQSDGRPLEDRPDRSPAAAATDEADRLGVDAGAWLQRMFAAERAFAFATAPEERSAWPAAAAAAGGGFAWPAGATLDAVRANFDVRWIGRERPAGRAVVVIDLVPRHDGPGWRFWIDVATGARLAYRATLADGRVVAEGRGEASALVPTGGEAPLRAPRAPSDARAAVWGAAFAGLEGFEPVDVARVRLGADVPAVRVTLWDGLSGVVLLVYPTTRNPARGELIVTRTVGELTLALVGPLPEAVAEAYLEALASRRWAGAEIGALLRLWAAAGDEDDGAPP